MRIVFHTSITSAICIFSCLTLILNTSTPAQIIGTIDTVGTTWYDMQHNATCGRMIRVDSQNNIHVVWMNMLDSGINRHVYYNMWFPASGWYFGNTGIAVESTQRGGYTCLALDTDDNTYIALHVVMPVISPDAAATCITRMSLSLCPFVYDPSRLEIIWPKIAVDIDHRIHMINTENPAGALAGAPQRIFYVGGDYDPIGMEIVWDDSQRVIDWLTTISADIAASRSTERVAFVYCDIRETLGGDSNQYNNDIYLVVSEDGINWDLHNPINITNFIYPDSTNPDTIAAKGDTLRAYADASVFFDDQDNIHVAFTTPYYDEINFRISWSNSLIWHWSESTGYYSLVADGWFDELAWGGLMCGAWQRYVQRPCIAQDETAGNLLIVYQQFDTSDIAANGYPQADAMISRSIDGGIRWSVGTNVTNTHAPGGNPGDCMHERDITCNETVENDTLHIFYVLDKDAGSVPYNEGTWTLNQAICQRIPIDQIPSTPLMPIRPMHIDSTGMPSLSVPRPEDAKIPSSFTLYQNYPNPFNPTTTIQFYFNCTDHVTLKMYNILGQEIATLVDANLSPGTYKVPFTADNLSSGIYFYTLTSSTHTQTKKIVLLK